MTSRISGEETCALSWRAQAEMLPDGKRQPRQRMINPQGISPSSYKAGNSEPMELEGDGRANKLLQTL